eukprot:ANDGO_07115.mRNA.1 hypothetical protein
MDAKDELNHIVGIISQEESIMEDLQFQKAQLEDLKQKLADQQSAFAGLGKSSSFASCRRAWLFTGSNFLKVDRESALRMMKDDEKRLLAEIESVQEVIRERIFELDVVRGRQREAVEHQ